VTKSRDLATRQRSLTFEIDYPEAENGLQPRHRFMSAYEQKVESPDKNYQYLLFACDPYETVAFKVSSSPPPSPASDEVFQIPNVPVDKSEGRFFSNWDTKSRKFILQLYFMEKEQIEMMKKNAAPPPPPRPVLRYIE
jgi:splicing factor 3A subunit 2